MNWAFLARLGERLTPFRKRRPPEPREIAGEFSTEELADFLEGDAYPNEASPEFRDRLREELWTLVQQTHGPKSESKR